jgi:hypothetical protein
VPGGFADVVTLVSGKVTFQQAVLVPEPAAGLLLLLGLAVAARRRTR